MNIFKKDNKKEIEIKPTCKNYEICSKCGILCNNGESNIECIELLVLALDTLNKEYEYKQFENVWLSSQIEDYNEDMYGDYQFDSCD